MKKVLSVLCMALLAGGMIFTSCNKQYTITTAAEPAEGGTVTGGGTFDAQAEATLTATPNAGWEFVQWQDNSKENPVKVTVTKDETWTAHFKKVEPGVKVAFKNSNWDAESSAISALTASTIWFISAAKNNGQFPMVDVFMLTTATGNHSSGVNENNGALTSDDFEMIDYYETYIIEITDNQGATVDRGDWWAKNATVNIGSFDANTLKINANVNATMFSADLAFCDDPETGQVACGVADAPTTSMAVNINNITLQTVTAKDIFKKKGISGKAVRKVAR